MKQEKGENWLKKGGNKKKGLRSGQGAKIRRYPRYLKGARNGDNRLPNSTTPERQYPILQRDSQLLETKKRRKGGNCGAFSVRSCQSVPGLVKLESEDATKELKKSRLGDT